MAQAHKADEFVALEQLDRCRAMLARLTDQLAGA
jgi:acetylornithine deacetylase/succinyl-diaminopimelate desuccinylase-like protein